MKSRGRHGPLLSLIAAALVVGHAEPAYAYLDPGTGSMIVQGLIAGLAAAFFTLKLYWYRIKRFFFPDKPEDAETEEKNVDDVQR